MGQFLLLLIGALVVGAIVFGVAVLIAGDDPGLDEQEPDGRAVPLPATRPLSEGDISALRFDTALRGYRMAQVDAALRRAAYDIGYKGELIQVLQAEVAALRDGRQEEADSLRRARMLASGGQSNADADAALDAEAVREADAVVSPDDSVEDEPQPETSASADGAKRADGARQADDVERAGQADQPDQADWSIERDSSWRSSSTVRQ